MMLPTKTQSASTIRVCSQYSGRCDVFEIVEFTAQSPDKLAGLAIDIREQLQVMQRDKIVAFRSLNANQLFPTQ